jgi:hypothetical protein
MNKISNTSTVQERPKNQPVKDQVRKYSTRKTAELPNEP